MRSFVIVAIKGLEMWEIVFYYPAKADTVQITVQVYSDIYTVENLFAVQVSARKQNRHTLPLSLIFCWLQQLDNKSLIGCFGV